MPEMGERERLRALSRMDPKIGLLEASGAMQAMMNEDMQEVGAREFIAKPFDMPQLLEEIRETKNKKRRSISVSTIDDLHPIRRHFFDRALVSGRPFRRRRSNSLSVPKGLKPDEWVISDGKICKLPSVVPLSWLFIVKAAQKLLLQPNRLLAKPTSFPGRYHRDHEKRTNRPYVGSLARACSRELFSLFVHMG
jgi:CheY-like chemotaxis protein